MTHPDVSGLYDDAYSRILRFMGAVSIVSLAILWTGYGSPVAIGFGAGCLISALNFHWLKQVVSAVAEKITLGGRPGSSGVVIRFLLRYFLAAVVAYVIFKNSAINLYGFFAGLFLPVAAIFCEAGYELYTATLSRHPHTSLFKDRT